MAAAATTSTATTTSASATTSPTTDAKTTAAGSNGSAATSQSASTAPKHKGFMTSTWRHKSKYEWGPWHWFFEILDVHPTDFSKEIPRHAKTEKVPFLPQLAQIRWVLTHAFIPLLLHHAFVLYTGRNLSALQAFGLYSVFFKFLGIEQLRLIRRLGHRYGYLDGDAHERDGVPDASVGKVVRSLISTSTVRSIFTIFIAYRTSMTPTQAHWYWVPLETGLYGIILDFWFYWYHRAMHESEFLWKYHKTHHLTKHPNPLLTLLADSEQEFFDIAGIPLATYFTMKLMGFPLDFYSWWICHMFVVYTELAGHSGLRISASPPNIFSWVLRYFNAELVIEDHDLHHRQGWKTSGNYGKQTRLWDRIFGTCKDRIEAMTENVDYDDKVQMPLLGSGMFI